MLFLEYRYTDVNRYPNKSINTKRRRTYFLRRRSSLFVIRVVMQSPSFQHSGSPILSDSFAKQSRFVQSTLTDFEENLRKSNMKKVIRLNLIEKHCNLLLSKFSFRLPYRDRGVASAHEWAHLDPNSLRFSLWLPNTVLPTFCN